MEGPVSEIGRHKAQGIFPYMKCRSNYLNRVHIETFRLITTKTVSCNLCNKWDCQIQHGLVTSHFSYGHLAQENLKSLHALHYPFWICFGKISENFVVTS